MKGERGFTLLETSIALLILAVVGLGVSSLFFYAITNNSGAGDRAAAMALAQQQLEQLSSVSFDNLEATVTATGGTSKTVTNAGRQYQVTTSFTYSPVAPATPTLKTITITVTPLGRSTALSTSTVTIITQRASLKTGPYSG